MPSNSPLRFALAAILAATLCPPATAQVLKIGAGGGLLILISSEGNEGFQDRFTTPVSKMGYGFGPEAASLGAEVKFAPRGIHTTLAADFIYTPLRGSGAPDWVEVRTMLPLPEWIVNKAPLFTASFGPQWELLHGAARPYLGARVVCTWIPHIKVTYANENLVTSYFYKSGGLTRLGLSFLAGGEFDLMPRFSLDVRVRYNLTNLFHQINQEYNSYFNTFSFNVGLLFDVLG